MSIECSSSCKDCPSFPLNDPSFPSEAFDGTCNEDVCLDAQPVYLSDLIFNGDAL